MSIEKYKRALTDLLPDGLLWERIKTDGTGLFRALAAEFSRVDSRGADLLLEFGPGTATELIDDWETLLGIPDECSEAQDDLAKRRAQARAKLASLGGMNSEFFVELAAQLGFDAVVRDYELFRVGKSRVGGRLSNAYDAARDQFRVGSHRVGDRLKRFGWRYTFEVNTEASMVEAFRVGYGRVGDRLRTFENPLLECMIKKAKPAHTSVFFTFR